MSFGDHLDELRRRLLLAGVGVVALFVVALFFGSRILTILAAPLMAALREAGQAPTLLATSPLEGFGAFVKVSTVAALLVAMPWVVYQVWLFVAPGLYEKERRFVYFLIPLSAALTAVGTLFLYFVILPISLYFLITFGAGLMIQEVERAPLPVGVTLPGVMILRHEPEAPPVGSWWVNSTMVQLRVRIDNQRTMGVALTGGGGGDGGSTGGGMIAQQYRVSEYVSLVLMLGVAFAIAFQLPLVLLLLGWVGLVRAADLSKYRKQVLFGCVVGSALLPTQDPWSLLALSGVMYALFELGIIFMRFVPARRVAAGLTLSTPWDAPRGGGGKKEKAGTDSEEEA